jgi:threonine dehydrogenase-like Zn-dependent dehydrogenase
MKTWRLEELGRPLELVEAPEPTLRGGGAVIEVLSAHIPAYTGVLTYGSRGSLPTPLTLGTGCIGRVLEVADDVFGVVPGDIVVDSVLLGSGRVGASEEILVGWTGIGGRGNATATTTSMRSLWRDGVFAERALCAKETLIALPGADDWADIRALAALPWMTIAAEGLEQAQLSAGHAVVVLGATGQLGTGAVLVALARGASQVVAVGRNQTMLARLGALDARVTSVTLSGDRARDAEAIAQAGGADADVVIDTLGAVPTTAPILAGYDNLRTGGTLVLVGGSHQEIPLPYDDLMHRRLTVRGSWMATTDTILAVWRMIRAGLLDLNALSIHTVGLHEPDTAVALAATTSGLDFVVLVPQSAAVPTT